MSSKHSTTWFVRRKRFYGGDPDLIMICKSQAEAEAVARKFNSGRHDAPYYAEASDPGWGWLGSKTPTREEAIEYIWSAAKEAYDHDEIAEDDLAPMRAAMLALGVTPDELAKFTRINP